MTDTSALPAAFRGRRLVVFDLDGTLYRQAPLRRRMAVALALDAVRRRDARTASILRDYRRRREALADAGTTGFDEVLVRDCAAACGATDLEVREAVGEWIERRPLPALRSCAVPGAHDLFDRLRAAGVRIGVWSDYPVAEKLAALGLRADRIASATDPEVDVMKPDPRGLALMMQSEGADAAGTLMVGDRDERDGAAARALGVDFLWRSDRARPGETGRVRDFTPRSLEDAEPIAARRLAAA